MLAASGRGTSNHPFRPRLPNAILLAMTRLRHVGTIGSGFYATKDWPKTTGTMSRVSLKGWKPE